MTVTAVAMVRDEVDIIATTVQHMARQVDRIIVADNNSTDGTRDVLEWLSTAINLVVIDDPEIGYYQSRKMTDLARLAMMDGADWVVPFDADEWWYAPFHDRIADLLESLAPQWLCAAADLYDHVATGADPPDELDPVLRLGWRRQERVPLRKIACRARPDLIVNQGNHSASYDGGATEFTDHLVIRHFPYRSPQQFVRKVRNGAQAYAATDLPDSQGAHWRGYGAILEAEGEQALIDNVFREWFWVRNPEHDPSLIYDPAP